MSELILLPKREIILPHTVLFPKGLRGRDDFRRWHEILMMAGSKSNFLASAQVQESAGGVSFSAAANLYLRLWTAALSDTSTGSTGSEANYGSYAATQFGTGNNQTDAWNAASGTTTATVTNKNSVTCPTSTSGTNTITYIAVCTATTAGNIYYWTDVSSVTINSGDTPKLNAAALSIVED